MIKFLSRLWRDRGGNALAIAAAALPLLVGAGGLATDTVQWVLWKRELQRAADSAAFAGVMATAQGSNVTDAVNGDLSNNNQTGLSLLSAPAITSIPLSTPAGTWTDGVKVSLSVQRRLGFSSLFLANAPVITVEGTAALVDDGVFCAGGLKKNGAAITIGGSSSVNLGCNAISNGNANPSVTTNGATYNFTAPVVAGVGTLPTSINGVTKLQPHHLALKDPFEGKYSTSIPAGMSCTNFNSHRSGGGPTGVYTLSPGCFTSFSPGGSNTYNLQPGVYYLNNTNFTLNGSDTLIGTGVTIILTGTSPGSVQTNGNSTVQLSAPTSTNCASAGTCSYTNMLFIQSPSATADNNTKINGSNTSSYDGAMYFPKVQLEFTGSSGGITKCAMVMAYTLTFSGNTNLQNNTSGCAAATTVPGKMIRLVA